MSLVCKPYNSSMKSEWNRVVEESRNGTFLIKREYLEYHSDRFEDFSLVFEYESEIIAVLPANRQGTTLYSHQGLTYGGLIMTSRCKGVLVVEMFKIMFDYLRSEGFMQVIYKPIPYIYHKKPSEEDLYALYLNGAEISSFGISSTINLSQEVTFNSLRTRGVKKAIANKVEMSEESNFEPFWELLTRNLQERHSVMPVHRLSEIELLKSRFPDNIRLFTATKDGELLAGVVIYESDVCAHSQYIATSQKGRDISALDYLFSYLIKERYRDSKYFDFGISTEKNGEVLNCGLLSQKEGFGASGTIYKSYKIEL